MRFALAILLGAFLASAQPLTFTAQAAPQQNVEFDVFLPLRNTDQLDALLKAQNTKGSPNYHRWLTPSQFRARFGPNPQAIARISARLRASGLTVTATHSHGIRVRGPIDNVQSAFGVVLWNAKTRRGHAMLAARRPLILRGNSSKRGAHVVAFSSAVHMRSHAPRIAAIPANRYGTNGPYWFSDLKQAYDFPSVQALDGRGTTIGIVIPSDVLDSDIAGYFAHEKLKTPTIRRRPVFGGARFDPNDGNALEAALDVEQTAGMAPGATIVVYSIPDFRNSSVIAGYLSLVEDNEVDIVNSSFGGPEGLYTAAYNAGTDVNYLMRIQDEIFKQGNAQGITFVASSGDSGALGLPPLAYVTTPATGPSSGSRFLSTGRGISCLEPERDRGGRHQPGNEPIIHQALKPKYVSENAFGDPEEPNDPFGVGNLISGGYWGSGGGPSVFFAKPEYQELVTTV